MLTNLNSEECNQWINRVIFCGLQFNSILDKAPIDLDRAPS